VREQTPWEPCNANLSELSGVTLVSLQAHWHRLPKHLWVVEVDYVLKTCGVLVPLMSLQTIRYCKSNPVSNDLIQKILAAAILPVC
jgi:hypothetical protein